MTPFGHISCRASPPIASSIASASCCQSRTEAPYPKPIRDLQGEHSSASKVAESDHPKTNSSKLPAARQIRGELPGSDGPYPLIRFACEPIVAYVVGILLHKLNAYFCRLEPECMQGCSWRHYCTRTQTTHRAEAPFARASQPGFL